MMKHSILFLKEVPYATEDQRVFMIGIIIPAQNNGVEILNTPIWEHEK